MPQALSRPGNFSFTRDGVLSPELLTTFLLFMVAEGRGLGLRHVVLDFWDRARASGVLLPSDEPVSASAIGQARQRLPEDFFHQLLHRVADEIDGRAAARRWQGRRVYAVDGQKLNVGTWPELKEAFGVAEGSHCPQVLLSVMVDVLTRTPIDFEVDGRLDTGEREHFLRMLPSVSAGDLMILDRGYPSHEVLQEMTAAGVDFLIRVPASNSFREVSDFVRSGKSEAFVTISPPEGADPAWHDLDVRLVRIERPDGPAYFLTSLTSPDISVGDIDALYHLRWQSEEFFKLFTSEYAGQGQFRSRTASGIRQEVGALTLFLAITRVMATAADHLVEDADAEVFVSQKGAVLSFRQNLIAILLDDRPDRVLARITATLQRMLRTLDRRRPGRSYPRRSYRPRPKWGPSGRVGA